MHDGPNEESREQPEEPSQSAESPGGSKMESLERIEKGVREQRQNAGPDIERQEEDARGSGAGSRDGETSGE